MSETLRKKDKAIINKFQSLLRSGKDYDVDSMYAEAGEIAFMSVSGTRRIINRYYQGVISQEMINFIQGSTCSPEEDIQLFSEKFNVCERESRLIIRYIRRMK